jgi:hypothetical protein
MKVQPERKHLLRHRNQHHGSVIRGQKNGNKPDVVNSNLLFTADEVRQVDKSITHSKIIKIVASFVVVIGVFSAGIFYIHANNQSSTSSIITGSANKSLGSTSPNTNSTESAAVLKAKIAADQATANADQVAADKLKAQAQQYTNEGNSELASALSQQAAAQQAIANQAAQIATDSNNNQQLQQQEQAASAAQQQAIEQQQVALQQCQQQKDAALEPISTQMTQINSSLNALDALEMANPDSSQYTQSIDNDNTQMTQLLNQFSSISSQYNC